MVCTPYYVTSSAACLFVSYFSKLSCKRHDIRRKKKLHSTVFLFFLQLSLQNVFFISGRIRWDLLVNVLMSLWKVQDTSLHFYTHFNKDAQNKIPLKSVQSDSSCSIRAGGRTDGRMERTDTTKLTCSFLQMCERAYNRRNGTIKHSVAYSCEPTNATCDNLNTLGDMSLKG